MTTQDKPMTPEEGAAVLSDLHQLSDREAALVMSATAGAISFYLEPEPYITEEERRMASKLMGLIHAFMPVKLEANTPKA